ncbi:MAG: PQQ-binding-like beta-propeller repeat protein [Bryobacterales bacterium]|nr:PQQ-binding-like beta-propeller repeat protein [Bryobacterales bacterium]
MSMLLRSCFLFSCCGLLAAASYTPSGSDWSEWRGPARNGVSAERDLPTSWSPQGDNLAWKAPYGGRSTPIVMGDRVFLLNTVGQDATLQERVVCLDADTGKLLWEHRYNVFLSDVPPHRAAWSSPSGDPATGNIYVFGVGGSLMAFSYDGKILWQRFLGEDFGLVTTHGGRTPSPLIDGDLVIVSGINSGWGPTARGAQRFFAFDKKTGDTVWVSTPGGRPFDTTYAAPVLATINGLRLFIAGGGDGAVHALKVATGEPVWRVAISKRGINTGVALNGNTVYVSHGEENLDTSEMGLIAAIDGASKGEIKLDQLKWSRTGSLAGYSSPVIDGDRLLQIDNAANLLALDAVTGRELWTHNLGTIQKASLVYADGKFYVGTENGKFFILRARQDRCEVLDEDQLGTAAHPEEIRASAAVSRGRIFLVTDSNIYAIGKKKSAALPFKPDLPPAAPAGAKPAWLQVSPTEILAKPGETVALRARLFDEMGRFIKETEAEWSLDKLRGSVSGGKFAPEGVPQAGLIKASAAGLTAEASARVITPLPWSEDFESIAAPPPQWVNATGKYVVREVEGNKVLVKLADNPFTKRARVFMGPNDWSDYTVEVDGHATERRRQMGDFGVVAQRYALILFGTHQRIELQPWQPETKRTVVKKFPWKGNTWYRMKLRVENLPDGNVRALGKAWPRDEAEPAEWTIEHVDALPNRSGSPGLYADAPFEVFLDNLKVTKN